MILNYQTPYLGTWMIYVFGVSGPALGTLPAIRGVAFGEYYAFGEYFASLFLALVLSALPMTIFFAVQAYRGKALKPIDALFWGYVGTIITFVFLKVPQILMILRLAKKPEVPNRSLELQLSWLEMDFVRFLFPAFVSGCAVAGLVWLINLTITRQR